MKAYFRALAAWFTDPSLAQSAAGVTLLALTLYTGFDIPEPYLIGALRWISYINACIPSRSPYHNADRYLFFLFLQPAKYAYEAIMANEFRTLNLECSSLVPQGPGYESITLENQVCAVVGAVPGQTTVNGLRYLKLSFNYEWTHMWRVRKHHACCAPILTLL